MTNHVVLYQPEIPANTGNIARSCAATDTHLHLIKPLGFSTDDKMLRRAGLDYWKFVNITYYDSIEEFFEETEGGHYYLLTKFGTQPHTDLITAILMKIITLCLVEKQVVYLIGLKKNIKKQL